MDRAPPEGPGGDPGRGGPITHPCPMESVSYGDPQEFPLPAAPAQTLGPFLPPVFPRHGGSSPDPARNKGREPPPSAEFGNERLNLDKVGFFFFLFPPGNSAARVPGTQRIAAGCQGGIPWKRRAVGMVAVPVSLPPFPRQEKRPGFMAAPGGGSGSWDGCGGESSRVSREISRVFPALATPLLLQPCHGSGCLKREEDGLQVLGK